MISLKIPTLLIFQLFFPNFEIDTLPHINTFDHQSLTTTPTFSEITNILFSIHPFKALEDDGLNAYFYQHSWNIRNKTIISLIINIFTTWELPPSWGKTLLCLIPKFFLC